MQEIARRIANVSKESKLIISEDEYVSSFKVELMDAVVQWCRGASFSDICQVCYSGVRLPQRRFLSPFYSSRINLKEVSFVYFVDWQSFLGKCIRLPELLGTRSCKGSSKKRRRCLNDRILSSSAHRYTYKKNALVFFDVRKKLSKIKRHMYISYK
jgi:hypothetical protein